MIALFTLYFLTGSPSFFTFPADAFIPRSEKTFYADTLLRPEERYKRATLISQYLFNGPRYHLYDRAAATHQFYKKRELLAGSVVYDGEQYGPFDMLYDIHFNQLIIKHPANGFLIRLDSPKIKQFTLDNDLFRFIGDHPELPDNFYNILHEGSTKLYCRRKRSRTEKIVDFSVITTFHNDDTFFLNSGNGFKRIRTKKDLYLMFPDRKNQIRSYFRKEQSTFKSNMETHLLNVVRMIDHSEPGL